MPGAPPEHPDLSDSPTGPARAGADRRRDLLLPTDRDPGRRPANGRPSARPESRLPRPGEDDVVRARPGVPPVPQGPRTAMAPFQAVPAPEAQPDRYSPEGLAAGGRPVHDEHDETAPPVRMSRTPVPPRRRAPEVDLPSRDDDERFAPWSTGPSGRIGQAGPPPPPSATYGDWTRPSRDQGPEDRPASGRAERRRAGGPDGARRAPAPLTSAIPERFADGPDSAEFEWAEERPGGGAGRQNAGRDNAGRDNAGRDNAGRDNAGRDNAGRESHGHGTGERPASPRAVGGRAALRAQRQAAEADRIKSARQQGERDEFGAPRRGRGRAVATALVAVAVVALGVLGVYSFTSPKTRQAASTSPAASTPSVAPGDLAAQATASLPPLVASPPAGATPAANPVKVPITVLNETGVTGLAAKIAGTFGSGGWPTTPVGAYKGNDVAATTVYFTQGDDTQRQAATALIAQFPKLSGPAPRFFDVPGNATPGLVVVAAGDWQP